MNYFEDQVAAKLQTENIGTIGTDIFISELPESVQNDILILVASAPTTTGEYDLRTTTIDFWVRNQSYSAARAKAFDILRVFQFKGRYDLGDFRVYSSVSLLPEHLGSDVNNYELFKVSVTFIYYDKFNSIS